MRSLMSIQFVKSVQSALFKLMKVFLLRVLLYFWAIKVVVMMGRWSDGSCFSIGNWRCLSDGKVGWSGQVR